MRDAFVLPQMFQPRSHEECFQESPFLSGVFEHAPRVCAVAAALMRKSFEDGQEFVAFPGIDSVFDRHQHGSAVGMDFA